MNKYCNILQDSGGLFYGNMTTVKGVNSLSELKQGMPLSQTDWSPSVILDIKRPRFGSNEEFISIRCTEILTAAWYLTDGKQSIWDSSIQTSRPKKNPRLPHFCVFFVPQNARINPCVGFCHVDDAQRKGPHALPVECEPRFIQTLSMDRTVSPVEFAYVLNFAVTGGTAEPVDRVTGDVNAVTVNSLCAEDGRIENIQGFLL